MKYIIKYLGGSHAYALNTAASDKDLRGIFLHTDVNKVIGLDRFEHQEFTSGGRDEKYKELRHFLCLLRNANSEAVETLFLDESCILEASDEYFFLRDNRKNLVNPEKLYRCIKGYVQGELKKANATGETGAVDRPKNFVQALRLLWSASKFFQSDEGFFPTMVTGLMHETLMHIKTQPQEYTKENLNLLVSLRESIFEFDYNNRFCECSWDEQLANEICLKFYGPIIADLMRPTPEPEITGPFSNLRKAYRAITS